MTAAEIRQQHLDLLEKFKGEMLREIAAQAAEVNQELDVTRMEEK